MASGSPTETNTVTITRDSGGGRRITIDRVNRNTGEITKSRSGRLKLKSVTTSAIRRRTAR